MSYVKKWGLPLGYHIFTKMYLVVSNYVSLSVIKRNTLTDTSLNLPQRHLVTA